jgi:hypothetical protein
MAPTRAGSATQLRHAKLWFAEIKEGPEDAEKQFPTHDGIPVADMIKTIIGPAIEQLEKAVGAEPRVAPNSPPPSTSSPTPATPATRGLTSRSFAPSARPSLEHCRCSNWLCALRQGGLADVAELLPIRHPRHPILSAWARCKSTGVVLPTRCGRVAAVGVCSDDTIRVCGSASGSKGAGDTTIHGVAFGRWRNRLRVWNNRGGWRNLSRAGRSLVWVGRYAPNVRRLCNF